MESSNGRKRRGFMKGKLTPFYKAAKLPPSSTSQQYNSSSRSKTKQTGLVGYVFHQDYTISQQLPNRNVSLLVVQETTRDSLTQFDNPYGVAVDEGVDIKAANYISSMQERFKLELVSSADRKAVADPAGDAITC